MQRTVAVILSILFTGSLLLYTAQANLDLLTRVSPNPQLVVFALIALEGGVLYWTGYFKLHENSVHRGIAIVMIFIDFVFSMTGFFVDANMIASHHDVGTALAGWFPSVILIVTIDLVLNVFSGIIVHVLPQAARAPSVPVYAARTFMRPRKNVERPLQID